METSNNGSWVIDPVHSKIRFESKYLLLTAVTGWFNEMEGTVVTGYDNFDACSISLLIYTNSLTTQNESRDEHLRSADFFDTASFPTIRFQSTEVKSVERRLAVTGDLTIKGVTKLIRFDAGFLGTVNDPYGNRKAGFTLNTTLNRKDFDISWNKYFDQEGILLSDEVTIVADLQLMKLS
ncbi:YceI family protein [Flavihumibacter sp. ZG627]|uniref:YceI family protein n=1 Tax=Flavihumibacter sp. ZG627 TaxID=1463156 RepID=UPI00057D555E|nr:YceI family protein [Flavihumibacter sp. ZG627]KIC91674.1 hypothetical protein HY58_05440 [Flavihumibacter sp. ZG627]